MAERTPIVLSSDKKTHTPLAGGDTLPPGIVTVIHDESLTGSGTTADPLRVSENWLATFIKKMFCDGCWEHITESGTEEVSPFREGKFIVTIGNGFGIVDMDQCATYTASVLSSGSTFKFGNVSLTGDANAAVKVNWVGSSTNIGQVYQSDSQPSWGTSIAPEDYYLQYFLSPFADMTKTPGNTAMYCVGSYSLEPGTYEATFYGDDVARVYIGGNYVGEAAGSGGWKKQSFTVTTGGVQQVIVFDKNIPDNTSSWFALSILDSTGALVHAFTKSDFQYSVTADLSCVE